ncbi:phenylacetic acid degradation protein [Litorivivens lipolytica]|uniref:Phenylacetic acid degradation protein n=1 Tax=Litorivivens lipolytica TaxID=1524264 RepID=A0A7W4Z4K1_9GAMM|nr:transferase hexapeptide repeat family protein [Litorivivens lipolytica]MBB3046579.1 phenylacetic acid degradation protein [Litorivivens lipolytica]
MAKVYSLEGVIPVVHPSSFVHPEAVLIGDVRIGKHCFIGPFACLRGDFGTVEVHDGANIQDHCMLHSFPEKSVVVESYGHIGHGAVLHGCRVGRNALVGINATVMDDVTVGEEAFVGGNAFVKAGFTIPRRSLVSGVPARIIRELSDDEVHWKTDGTEVYKELVLRYRKSFTPAEPLTELEENRPRLQCDRSTSIALHERKANTQPKEE